jgi:hypothetical protein
MLHHTSGNARPKIYGPFWPYNKRGLPIVMKNGIPAWMVVEPRNPTPPAKDAP